MKIEVTEARWLVERHEVSLEEVCRQSGLSERELRELVEQELLSPVDRGAARWSFTAECIELARDARRLRIDLELDEHALGIVVALRKRIQELESELRAIRARLPVMR